jgi:Trp operon repressor
MSENVHPERLKKAVRLEKIKGLLPQGRSYSEIASLCGVDEKTIRRDIKEWRDNGGFEDWLQNEFFALHNQVRDTNMELAYKIISGLLEKNMKQRVEATVEGGIVIQAWDLGNGKDKAEVPAAPGANPLSS